MNLAFTAYKGFLKQKPREECTLQQLQWLCFLKPMNLISNCDRKTSVGENEEVRGLIGYDAAGSEFMRAEFSLDSVRLKKERERYVLSTMTVKGLNIISFLRTPDGGLPEHGIAEGVKDIAAYVRSLNE